MKKPSYLAAAFNARPFGMPIPPNWFGIAAFGLLGALVNPGLWLIGLGLEGLYLWSLSRNPRFRNVVDANAGFTENTSRYESLLANLDSAAQTQQYEVEREAAEIASLLQRSGSHDSQIGDVRQLAWLHLKMLAARASFIEVVAVADRERKNLDEQERRARAPGGIRHRRRPAPQPRTTDRGHPVAPQGARRRRTAPGTGGRRTRPAPAADFAGARTGAAGHRREQHRAFAGCAQRLAQRGQPLAQGPARAVHRPRYR
jgi:hypothetical protein